TDAVEFAWLQGVGDANQVHNIVGIYSGDEQYTGDIYQPFTVTVVRQGGQVPGNSLNSSANPATVGTALTFTPTITPTAGLDMPSGTVKFLDGNAQLGIGTLSGGIASTTVSNLAIGKHDITAIYSGDNEYAATTNSIEQTINDPNGSSGSQS